MNVFAEASRMQLRSPAKRTRYVDPVLPCRDECQVFSKNILVCPLLACFTWAMFTTRV
jgi:hypothetical protein